jgi:hypothetical protein
VSSYPSLHGLSVKSSAIGLAPRSFINRLSISSWIIPNLSYSKFRPSSRLKQNTEPFSMGWESLLTLLTSSVSFSARLPHNSPNWRHVQTTNTNISSHTSWSVPHSARTITFVPRSDFLRKQVLAGAKKSVSYQHGSL